MIRSGKNKELQRKWLGGGRYIACLAVLFTMQCPVSRVYAQAPTQQQINITGTDFSIKEVFNIIEKQTGYSFTYSKQLVGVDKKAGLPAGSMTVKNILADISARTGLKFEQSGITQGRY
jgi:hypothetical protein